MDSRKFWTLLVTIVGSGIVMLDGSIVNLALPVLQSQLGASFSQLQWIMDGYLLSLSALILLGGSLGDIFGRRKVYLIGLAGFGVASLLCGLAPNADTLIAARVLQGIFGALVVPGGLAIINTNFTPGERGRAIGLWSAWSAAAIAIAPFVGGLLLDFVSWRWIFFINIPLVATALYLGIKHVKESDVSHGRRVDYEGAALAVAFLAALSYGLIEGPAQNWHISTVISLILSVVFMGWFIAHEHKKRDPIVNLGLFKSRNFSGSNIMTLAIYGAFSGLFFVLAIRLQNVLDYSATATGLILLPVTIIMILFSGKIGGMVDKYGTRMFMTVGPALCGLAMVWLLPLGEGSSLWLHILPAITLFGIGIVLMAAPLTTTVMNAVQDKDSGIASGINNAVSRAAGLVVIALLGLFAGAYQQSVLLCAVLAFGASAVSFLMIRDHKTGKRQVQ